VLADLQVTNAIISASCQQSNQNSSTWNRCQPERRSRRLSALLQIDGLVVPMVIELGAPYFVGALVLALTEADERAEAHVVIA